MPYATIKFSYPIWFYVVNRTRRKQYEEYEKNHTQLQERLLESLSRDGYVVTNVDELFPDQHRLSILTRYVENQLPNAEERHKKKFLKKLWSEEPLLDMNNPFMALAAEKTVLEIIAAYLGVFPIATSFWLDITVPVGERPPQQSQCWHRDPEDKRMLKFFLYVNDVDKDAGPFTYIAGSQYGGKYGHLFPAKRPRGSYPDAHEVAERVDKKDIHELTGKAGTIILADTAGLHRGGHARLRERIMFTACFVTSAFKGAPSYVATDAFKKQHNTLTPLTRYALNTNEIA